MLIVLVVILASCQKTFELEPITIEDTDYVFTETIGDKIEVVQIDLPYSTTAGQLDNFINIHKPMDINPIYFMSSTIKTHQVCFTFENIYPLDYMTLFNPVIDMYENIVTVDIDVSYNGTKFSSVYDDVMLNDANNHIDLGGVMARTVKLTFPKTDQIQTLSDVSFYLADGVIIKEDKALSDAFLRYDGWTGADGIFTFDLNHGGDRIGVDHQTTGFIFSDTFVGEVYENNKLRKVSNIINNSFGYLDHTQPFDRDQFSFAYDMAGDQPKSVIEPDQMIGPRAANLLDNDGITPAYDPNGLLTNINEGTMWLSDQLNNHLIVDFKSPSSIKDLYLWNYNDNSSYGASSIAIYGSNDGLAYQLIDTVSLDQASGNMNEPYTLHISFTDLTTRFIKLDILDSHHQSYVGLGKLVFLNDDNEPLFGEITAASELTTTTANEQTSRYWLQDGVVIGNSLYVFPILVKDESTIFKVHHVAMVDIPIVDQRLDYTNETYYHTPLMTTTPDGGVIYYGAGVMDNTDIDGYIYIYGYKDLQGRHLIVGRFRPQDIKNFNQWTYFDGQDWSNKISDSMPLIDQVSAELSVTYIPSGMFSNKYMLVVMEDTTSGRISYSLSDTPYGPFSEYTQIYQTNESTYLRDAFTYNAKLHPNLSEPGNYVISYNVNTHSVGALSDARIYYPRFIRIVEVKSRG